MDNFEDLLFQTPDDLIPIDDSKLRQVSDLASEAKRLDTEIANGEANIADMVTQREAILGGPALRGKLPELLSEVRLREFTTTDGAKMEVQHFVTAAITDKCRFDAHEWLREHGLGDIIKNTVTVALDKGEDDLANQLADMLEFLGVSYECAERVHPSTLKALVREQLKKGNSMPTDLFGIFEFDQANFVTNKKGKK